MSTGLKVVLWIVGGIAALIVLLVVGAFFVGRSMMDDMEEASKFAANATHEECVDELGKRINACDGVNCIVQTSVFGGTCLAQAKGDVQQFCAQVPQTSDQAAMEAWTGEFCAKQELKEEGCGIVSTLVSTFCTKSDAAAPK